MPTPRVYYPADLKEDSVVTLAKDASHHLLNVLRLRPQESVILFNGNGAEYHGHLAEVAQKRAVIKINLAHACQTESPLDIELGQGIARFEKMDFMIQKAVELGVQAITPLITTRCGVSFSQDRLEKKLSHWEKIILSAAEQSGRCKIPILNKPQLLTEWITLPREGLSLVCDPQSKKRILSYTEKPKRVTILLGSESGFTNKEVSMATENGFHRLSLGPRILRAETATVTALTLIQSYFGDG